MQHLMQTAFDYSQVSCDPHGVISSPRTRTNKRIIIHFIKEFHAHVAETQG
jgi:hypothetical protein